MFAPVGEVSVNPGGEPERDDTGLPPVKIEIPDDARELDRDVQAYYREQRAQRRQQRRVRLHGSLARDGILLPLLACCLILALITGTLLTVFTATSDQNLPGPPGSGPGGARPPAAKAGPTATPDTRPGELPVTATITASGLQLPVSGLRRAMLVLMPAHCDCSATLSWLVGVAASAQAAVYLVYVPATKAEAERLYLRLDSKHRMHAVLALETGGSLQRGGPAGHLGSGLTAILLGPGKGATYATGLSAHDNPATLMRALSH